MRVTGEVTTTTQHDGRVTLYGGDNRDALRGMADCSVDSIVTDPPYALVSIVKRFGGTNAAPAKDGDVYARASAGFMGKQWDTGEVAFATEFWAECLRVLKPGGHVVAFSGTRTYHRLAVAIEDSGFEIRDQLAWIYGTGFPKSHDVSKGIDKTAGAVREVVGINEDWVRRKPNGSASEVSVGFSKETDYNIYAPATPEAREWQGWGTALKPAWEPIVLARKTLVGTVAANVLEHGTGAINIDGCRVAMSEKDAAYIAERIGGFNNTRSIGGNGVLGGGDTMNRAENYDAGKGRWPANIFHDGSDEVQEAFGIYSQGVDRFFYSGKASKRDRDEGLEHLQQRTDASDGALRDGDRPSVPRANTHPTVKPTALMQWLCRLVTPPGGVVLDPFMGSGSTGKAAVLEGFRFVGMEREAEYIPISHARIAWAVAQQQPAPAANDNAPRQQDLFGSAA